MRREGWLCQERENKMRENEEKMIAVFVTCHALQNVSGRRWLTFGDVVEHLQQGRFFHM